MFRFITKWWNILVGNDVNKDGKVDIKDSLAKAEKKAKITTQNIGE
jgi:hypothetical protein